MKRNQGAIVREKGRHEACFIKMAEQRSFLAQDSGGEHDEVQDPAESCVLTGP